MSIREITGTLGGSVVSRSVLSRVATQYLQIHSSKRGPFSRSPAETGTERRKGDGSRMNDR